MDEENDLKDSGKKETDSMNFLLPYPDAQEERDLWKRYFKLRRINEILCLESIAHKVSGVGRILTEIVEDISKSVDLVVLLRKLSDLDSLGDKILEDSSNTTATMVELYRLMQNSEATNGNEVKSNRDNSCRLRDLFGFIFVEMLNNIAFGKGNPNLVDKIIKATKGDIFDIRTRIYRLAINRELMPKNIIKLIDPQTPVVKLPPLVQDILPEQFNKNVLKDYQSFINNARVDGKKAYDRIIETHLRLVHKNARFLVARVSSLLIDDLIQEGSIGLMKAVEHFDPAYGYRFMTYAPYWIQQANNRAISDQDRTIRVPVHMVESINKLLGVNFILTQEYGRKPTLEEISEKMNLSLSKVDKIVKIIKMPISSESPITEEEKSQSDDYIINRIAIPPSDTISEQLLTSKIDAVLIGLTSRAEGAPFKIRTC